jgi:hypothetical protein
MYVIEVRYCTRIGNEHTCHHSQTPPRSLLLGDVESFQYHTAGENATVNSKTTVASCAKFTTLQARVELWTDGTDTKLCRVTDLSSRGV